MDFFDESFLWASLFWGSLGTAYFVYGKRARSFPALAGGMVMVAASIFVTRWWQMSLIGIGLMAAVYYLRDWGR
jgi:hypothetical protein